ncbi:hypothetical protein M427DRAFT_157896 [Gonapodya prolifera JEL478]|uniref:Repressor of RNA polymerase III transcription MAF1 n=1 Tax=Gonapodya prolifera (strain JEL478) TaxID=1344416 RepID=A0A139A4U8_GONPJ|nr:hypothetical protein M427DRAFT_157896 [Gonapodya prolifera JEL478]|eukprot:KXS11826.1 hypothetical protein M427DRAFT_157896 [Gonapodya prolifera JEL478]
MKYLDVDVLDYLNANISSLDAGDHKIYGRVEAYLCRTTPEDRRLRKEIECRYPLPCDGPTTLTTHIGDAKAADETHLNGAAATASMETPPTPVSPFKSPSHSPTRLPPSFPQSSNPLTITQHPPASTTPTSPSFLLPASLSGFPIPMASSLGVASYPSSWGSPHSGFSSFERFAPTFGQGTAGVFEDKGVPLDGVDRDKNARKTYFLLVATLNSAWPEYDFSSVPPSTFLHLPTPLLPHIRSTLSSSFPRTPRGGALLDALLAAVDEAIETDSAEGWRYEPEGEEGDPYGEVGGYLWAFHYLFLNRRIRKVVYVTLRAASPLETPQTPPDAPYYPADASTPRHPIYVASSDDEEEGEQFEIEVDSEDDDDTYARGRVEEEDGKRGGGGPMRGRVRGDRGSPKKRRLSGV